MNRPWSSRRARTKVRLIDSGDGGSLLRPLNPPLPPRVSSGKTREAVRRHVTGLAGAGSLDAGNGDVLDRWLDSLRPQWLAHHAVDSTERTAVAAHLTGRYEAEAAAARQRAQHAAAERDHTQRLVAVYERQLLEPSETPALTTDRRRRPRPTVDRLEGLTDTRGTGLWAKGLLLLAAAGDFAAFYIVLAEVFGENPAMTFLLVAAFTAASVGLMHVVGQGAKNLREGRGGLGRVAIAAMALAWAVLGSVAFYVRTQADPVTTATTEVAFGADPAAAGSSGVAPILSAVLLAGLFIASGLLAFSLGFSHHHPRMTAYRALRTTLVRQRESAARAEQQAIAAERAWQNARAEQARAAERALHAASSVDAELAELKELVRIQVAEHIGEPASTNALTTGRANDDSPDRADDGDRPGAPAADEVVPVPVRPLPPIPGKKINGHPPLTGAH
jgi:hypothetical protein